jgi:hypothetical protein
MYIFAYFCGTDGAPETGLSPTADVYRIEDTTQVLTAQALTEIGDGWYYYDYSTADEDNHYVITVDGGATLPGLLRYAKGAGKPDGDIIASIESDVDEIKTKIDNQYFSFRDMRRKHPEWRPFEGGGNEPR